MPIQLNTYYESKSTQFTGPGTPADTLEQHKVILEEFLKITEKMGILPRLTRLLK